MKLVTVTLLVLGMLCTSTLATAEGPVPFRDLMQTVAAQPSISPNNDATNKSTSTQPAHTHLTSSGKIMTGTGIGMVVIGAGVITLTGILHDLASPSRKAALFGGGGAVAAGGITLVILGNRRRSAK